MINDQCTKLHSLEVDRAELANMFLIFEVIASFVSGLDDSYVYIDRLATPRQHSNSDCEDSKYLSMKFERKLELRTEMMGDDVLERLSGSSKSVERIPFMATGTQKFILEDR